MNFTENATLAINSETTNEVFLELVEITSAELSAPLRLVNNNEDVIHQGEIYYRFRYDLKWPNTSVQQAQDAEIILYDLNQKIVPAIRLIQNEVKARFFMILASDPDIKQQSTSEFRLKRCNWDASKFSAFVGPDHLLDSRYPPEAMTRHNAPAIH